MAPHENKVLYRDMETDRLKVRDAELEELKYLTLTKQELNVLYNALARTLISLKGSDEYKHYLRLIMAKCRKT